MLSRDSWGLFIGILGRHPKHCPLEISHLFAVDMLIMCDVDHEQIYILGHILHCFEAISGLKVNLRKFELVAVEEVPHQEELADIINCSFSFLQLKSLRLPLGASFKSKAIWEEVVEKMKKRLAKW